jgi:glycerol kinase
MTSMHRIYDVFNISHFKHSQLTISIYVLFNTKAHMRTSYIFFFNIRYTLQYKQRNTHTQVDLTSATSTPSPGWAELNMTDIYRSVEESARGAMEKVNASSSDVVALGITNQRETLCVWDKTTGEPLHQAILWLDTRNRDTVATLETELGDTDALRDKCGLPISTYFSGVKLRWLIDNVPDVANAVKSGNALIGTVDSWLIWKLTNGKNHVTDVTNASRTMMMDLKSVSWDQDLMSSLGLSECLDALPQIVPSADLNLLGRVHDGSSLAGVPITGCIGDQQSAMVGQKCFGEGDAKTTFGTGAFTLMNTGKEPCNSKHGLLTTVLYQMGSNEDVQYVSYLFFFFLFFFFLTNGHAYCTQQQQ